MRVDFVVDFDIDGSVRNGGSELWEWGSICEFSGFAVIEGIGGRVLEIGCGSGCGGKPEYGNNIRWTVGNGSIVLGRDSNSAVGEIGSKAVFRESR